MTSTSPSVHAPARGLEVSGDDVDERRLAGAVRTDETQDLALVDREADIFDRTEPTEVLAHPVGHQLAVGNTLRSLIAPRCGSIPGQGPRGRRIVTSTIRGQVLLGLRGRRTG